jgi:ABC-type Fe3+/spermidine/putrescine transport system ATPase subunit
MRRLALRRVSHVLGGTTALQQVDLEIAKGEPIAVLGLSGAGKSTLLRLLAGLDAPSEGEIWDAERILSGAGRVLVPPHERRISMVFQDLALWPNLSALDNVLLGLARSPLSRHDRRARAMGMLVLCGIESLASRLPAALSGGEQQRVALARALAPAPDWLLLDEPFSNLDPMLRDRLVADVRALATEQRATIVFVTHDLVDALELTRRAVVLEQGRVVEAGAWETLLAAAKSDLLSGLAARAERARAGYARFPRPAPGSMPR